MATIRVDLALSLFQSTHLYYTAAADVCTSRSHTLFSSAGNRIGAVGDSNKTISGSERRRRTDFPHFLVECFPMYPSRQYTKEQSRQVITSRPIRR